jgi:hypothetical protein
LIYGDKTSIYICMLDWAGAVRSPIMVRRRAAECHLVTSEKYRACFTVGVHMPTARLTRGEMPTEVAGVNNEDLACWSLHAHAWSLL